jgi:hypothetical protein
MLFYVGRRREGVSFVNMKKIHGVRVWRGEGLTGQISRFRPGLPDGRGHGRITQNRQYKNKSGRGKLPAVKVAVSDKTIFLLLKDILVHFLVG